MMKRESPQRRDDEKRGQEDDEERGQEDNEKREKTKRRGESQS